MNLLHVHASAQEAANAAATAILRALGEAIAIHGRATLAVSGGSTPKLMFEALAQSGFDFSRVHLFFVDERCVPPDHADSNYRMTKASLIDRVALGSVHRIEGELPPHDAAGRYARDVEAFLGSEPVFDIVHLGMGADAHTASLFPGLAEIDDRAGTAAAVWVPKLNAHRVTLLPRVLLAARATIVLAAGADKAQPLRDVYEGAYDPQRLPIQIIHRYARAVDWYVDTAAAASLARSA